MTNETEKPNSHLELLEQLDTIVGYLLEFFDPSASREEKMTYIERKCRNLRMLFDICDKENDINFSATAGVLRIEFMNQNGEKEVLHEFSVHALGILDWMGDASVDYEEQDEKWQLTFDLFQQVIDGEDVLGELKMVLSEIFEEQDGQPQMKPEANVEMTRRRVKRTGEQFTNREKGAFLEARELANPFARNGIDWNNPDEMRHYLSLMAHDRAVDDAADARN